MPDSFEHTPSLTMRMPNGALASIAGNVDRHHEVAIADLVLVQDRVRATVERLVAERQPEIVGLSVMTFQRRTAHRLLRIIKALRPEATIVLGGYDPSLASDAYEDPSLGVDFIVRGEGDLTFRDLIRSLEANRRDVAHIPGLLWRSGDRFVHNAERPVSSLDGDAVRLPNRAARVLKGYTFLGRPIDVVETSRGCTYDCSFCSIIEMRGRNFHTWTFDRVLADISDAKARGARAIFLVDDNITLNVARFEALCRAMVDAGVNDIDYIVQGMTSSIANHGETLAPLMRRAGFRYVFLGIENILDGDLEFLKARSKNAEREHGRTVGNASARAVDILHRHGMYVVGGLIVGNPDDTRESIEANLTFARQIHRLAVHSAPDAISADADDEGLPRPGAHRQRELRGVRRDDCRRANEAPGCRRRGVHAVAGRALDEAPAFPRGTAARSGVRRAVRAPDVRPYVPRQHVAIGARTRDRARRLPALQSRSDGGNASTCPILTRGRIENPE